MGDSEAYNGPQRGSEGWHGPRDDSTGPIGPMGLQGDSIDESEGCDGPQTGSKGWDEPVGEPTGDSTPIDQFCSSCNQKKPLIDFSRFLICNSCWQRNRKANQARHLKQKALLNKSS